MEGKGKNNASLESPRDIERSTESAWCVRQSTHLSCALRAQGLRRRLISGFSEANLEPIFPRREDIPGSRNGPRPLDDLRSRALGELRLPTRIRRRSHERSSSREKFHAAFCRAKPENRREIIFLELIPRLILDRARGRERQIDCKLRTREGENCSPKAGRSISLCSGETRNFKHLRRDIFRDEYSRVQKEREREKDLVVLLSRREHLYTYRVGNKARLASRLLTLSIEKSVRRRHR